MTARAPRMLHMMIRVMDLEKTVHFYTELLGMKVIRKRDNPDGKYTLTFVGYGGEEDSTVIELIHNWDREEPYTHGTGFGHLAIGVDDAYETCERVEKGGGIITRPAGPRADGGSVFAFIEDPDGYKIEVAQTDKKWLERIRS